MILRADCRARGGILVVIAGMLVGPDLSSSKYKTKETRRRGRGVGRLLSHGAVDF